jgi:hypothetical protein
MSRLWRFDVRLVRVLSRLGGDLSASDCQSRGNEYGATDSVTGKEVVSVNVRYARAGRRASDPSAGYAPCPERAGLATVIQGTDGRVLLAAEVRRVSGLTTLGAARVWESSGEQPVDGAQPSVGYSMHCCGGDESPTTSDGQ